MTLYFVTCTVWGQINIFYKKHNQIIQLGFVLIVYVSVAKGNDWLLNEKWLRSLHDMPMDLF